MIAIAAILILAGAGLFFYISKKVSSEIKTDAKLKVNKNKILISSRISSFNITNKFLMTHFLFFID